MKPILLIIAISSILAIANADDRAVQVGSKGEISIASRGSDVREVLHDLFTQSKKNYVIESALNRQSLFLSLNAVEFDEALQLICKMGNLEFQLQNGIYFVNKADAKKVVKSAPIETPKRRLSPDILLKKVTTRLAKTELSAVFAELAKQTGVRIELGKDVPAYRVDAFLINTSLKYALDELTKATGLNYSFTDAYSIAITKPESSRVAVIGEKN